MFKSNFFSLSLLSLKLTWGILILVFAFSNGYSQQVKLAWTPPPAFPVAKYGIYRAPHPDSTFTLLGQVPHPDTMFTDTNVRVNTHYYYVATSIDQSGTESGYSNMVDTTIYLTQMVLFALNVSNNTVALEWTVPSAESNRYFGFEVQRSDSDRAPFISLGYISALPSAPLSSEYSYADKNLATGKYYYRLKMIRFDGNIEFSKTIMAIVSQPEQLQLYPNYPNPFNSSTIFSYQLPEKSHVELKIFDNTGQEIFRLIDEFQDAGYYSYTWTGMNLENKKVATGVYYLRLKAMDSVLFRKLLLLK